MNVYQWLCLLGVPTLLLGLISFLIAQIRKTKKDSAAIRKGIQALLRAQMIADYNHYSELEHAPLSVRDSFENCWVQYHGLGANGVMDDLHAKFMALPIEPPADCDNRSDSL